MGGALWKWLLALLVFLGIALSVYIFKRNLSEFAIVRYLRSKGIAVELEVAKLSLTDIVLKNVRLEERTFIPLIELQFKNEKGIRGGLSSLIIEAENLDVPEMMKVAQHLAGAPKDSEPPTSSVQKCNSAVAIPLQAKLKTLSWDKVVWPVDLVLNHPKGYPEFSLRFSGKTDQKQQTAAFSLAQSIYGGEVHVECREHQVAVENVSIYAMGEGFKLTSSPQVHEKIHLQIKQADFILSETEQLSLEAPLSLEWKAKTDSVSAGKKETSRTELTWPELQVKGKASLLGKFPFDLTIEGKSFKMHQPQQVALSSLQVQLKAEDFRQRVEGHLQASGLDYRKDNKPLVVGAVLKGPFQILPQEYHATLQVSDRAGSVNGPALVLFARPEQSIYEAHLKEPLMLKLAPGLRDTFPSLQAMVHSFQGELSLSGHWSSAKGIMAGQIKIDGEHINLDSEYGKFDDVAIHHDIVSLPSLESSPHQKISVGKMEVGPGIDNSEIVYQLENLQRLKVENLVLHFEEGSITAQDFLVLVSERRLENFKATIQKMSLQKLLAIGLKQMVSAQGSLSGDLEVEFRGKIPAIHGKLMSDGPGIILYRPTSAVPAKNIRLSDGPADILNAYLYNYHYEDLSIDITTDDKYNVIMTLYAYGRNPDYLSGKPLKLKINLEQNLLTAFQSLMLTYDLPNKIKEHLEKVGSP